MLGRGRLFNIAIGFGLGIAVAFFVGLGLNEYQRRAECHYYSAEPHCQDAPNVGPSVRVSPISADSGPNPNPYPERHEWREEQDLKAQGRMAEWAFWAVIAAFSAVGITGVGVILLWFTLGYTRDAAQSARDMVTEGEKATTAALESRDEARVANELAAKNFAASSRPWLDISEVSVKYPFTVKPTLFRIETAIKFRNVGSTPALRIRTQMRVIIMNTNPFNFEERHIELREEFRGRKGAYGKVVFPDKEEREERPVGVSMSEYNSGFPIGGGLVDAMMFCVVSYSAPGSDERFITSGLWNMPGRWTANELVMLVPTFRPLTMDGSMPISAGTITNIFTG